MKVLEPIAVFLLAALAGCAGHEAMVWRTPQPYVEECPIKVCEHWGPGRLDPKKDCNKCAQSVQDIFRDLGL